MTAEVPILIIGGGIGGLTAALALARAGFTAHVVERSAEFCEIGAGIQLAPNALRVLDELGMLPCLAPLAVRPRRSAQVQRAARAWGQIWHDGGPVIPLLRDRIFARRDADDYTDVDWLYLDPRGAQQRLEAS